MVGLRFCSPALFGLVGEGASGGDIFGQMKWGCLCEVLGFGLEAPKGMFFSKSTSGLRFGSEVLGLVELWFCGPVLFGLEGAGASGGDILGQMKRGAVV